MFSNYNSYWLEQRKFTVKHMRDFGFGKTSMEDVVLEEADELAVSIRGKSRVQVRITEKTQFVLRDNYSTDLSVVP